MRILILKNVDGILGLFISCFVGVAYTFFSTTKCTRVRKSVEWRFAYFFSAQKRRVALRLFFSAQKRRVTLRLFFSTQKRSKAAYV